MKSILVTGSSSGIGAAVCQHFAKRGWKVFGSVRKIEDGIKLKEICGDYFTPLLFDVTDRENIKNAVTILNKELEGLGLDCLVNNAGINIPGPIEYQDTGQIRKVFEVNLMGVINCIQAFLPSLKKSKDSTIINISSMAGKTGLPMQGSYCMTKFGLEGLSESLRRELLIYGIKVVVIGPGAIESAIWEKIHEDDYTTYSNTIYENAFSKLDFMLNKARDSALPANVIAKKVEDIVSSNNPKIRYTVAAFKHKLMSKMPKKLLDKIFAYFLISKN